MKIKFRASVILFLIALMPMHSLITFGLSGTPLVAWKQLLGVALLPLVTVDVLNLFLQKRSLVGAVLALCVIIFLLYCLFLIVLDADRIVMYASAVACFVIFFFTCSGWRLIRPASFISVAFWVGTIVSIGVIFDFFTQFFFFLNHNADEAGSFNGIGLYRPVFTLGSSSLVFVVLGSCILIYLSKEAKPYSSLSRRGFLLWLTFIAVALSGSRMSLILLIGLTFFLSGFRWNVMTIGATLILGSFLLENELVVRFLSAVDLMDPGNVGRVGHWLFAFNNIELFLNPMGDGIGSVSSNSTALGTSHFESSFLTFAYELGVIGVIGIYVIIPLFLLITELSTSLKIFCFLLLAQSVFVPVHYNILYATFVGFAFAFFLGFYHEKNCRSYSHF